MNDTSSSRWAWQDAIRFDAKAALLPMPGMALLLICGVLLDQQLAFSVAAGAAFSVGFGANRRIADHHWLAMLVTVAGMTLAAVAGTLAGQHPVLELLATLVAGGICGALATRYADLWWVWLQIAIAFLVAANYPGDIAAAMQRAIAVAAGGLLQFMLITCAILVVGPPAARPVVTTSPTPRDVALHALLAALCMGVALAAGQALGFANVYWAPITAMLVLRPGLRDTVSRGLERIGGTLAGIVLATAIAGALVHLPLLLALATVLAASAAFGLQLSRYVVLSGAVTIAVLLMTVLAGSPVLAMDEHRLFATLLGGAIALAGVSLSSSLVRSRASAPTPGAAGDA